MVIKNDSNRFIEDLSREESDQLMADHRYDVIYPILKNESISKEKALDIAASIKYVHPINNNLVMYSESTINRWYYDYTNSGNKRSALLPKERSDKGTSKALAPATQETILKMKEDLPFKSAREIYKDLVRYYGFEGSERTVSGFIKTQNLNLKKKDVKYRLPFEKEFANQVWYADTKFGPFITINGQAVRTYLISFQDDAARFVVGSRFFLAENSENVQKVLKESVMRHGVADLHVFDNGSPYKNKQLARIIKTIGSNVHHCPPYEPQPKAKLERYYRTIDTEWLNNVDHSSFVDIDYLNRELVKYINIYNNENHSEIGMTPYERWMRDESRVVYLDNNNIDAYFLHKVERKVNNANIIKIDKVAYEVPRGFVGKKIDIFYSPDIDKKQIEYLMFDGKEYVVLGKLDKIANGYRYYNSKGINDTTKANSIPAKLPSLKAANRDFAVEKEDKKTDIKLTYESKVGE